VAINVRILSSARVVVALFAGCATGICGVHGWMGLLCFLLSQLLFAALSLLHARPRGLASFLPNARATLMWENLTQAAMTFVLFWTLLYDVVYVY